MANKTLSILSFAFVISLMSIARQHTSISKIIKLNKGFLQRFSEVGQFVNSSSLTTLRLNNTRTSLEPTIFHDYIFKVDKNSARNNDDPYLYYQIHDPSAEPFLNKFNPYVNCPLGENKDKKGRPTGEFRTSEVAPPFLRSVGKSSLDNGRFSRGGRVLDFTTTISTNLKMLFIGDSVMVQLAQAFDESVGAHENYIHDRRSRIWEAWSGHDGLTASAPVRGGGVSALWRLTALLSLAGKGRPPANLHGGGWSNEAETLLNHSFVPMATEMSRVHHHKVPPKENDARVTVGAFHVVTIRVQHGWMKLKEITRERLIEAIQLSHELLGATAVIVMTVPFSNNVKTTEDLYMAKQVNQEIRSISQHWPQIANQTSSGIRYVIVQEYGNFMNHIIWKNARLLGYNVSTPVIYSSSWEEEGPSFLFDRLSTGGNYPPTIAMVCANKTLNESEPNCIRNFMLRDGMHLCTETLGARYSASVGCLLGCIFNNGNSLRSEDEKYWEWYHRVERRYDGILKCAKECNDQFMTLVPIDESLVGGNTTLMATADA